MASILGCFPWLLAKWKMLKFKSAACESVKIMRNMEEVTVSAFASISSMCCVLQRPWNMQITISQYHIAMQNIDLVNIMYEHMYLLPSSPFITLI